jgi:hypothetical protein
MSINRNLLQRMRQTLYALKRKYGERIDIYKLVGSTTDAQTGAKIVSTTVLTVRRAIIMPARTTREAKQSPSLASSNKEFAGIGGSTDIGTRDFIIDRRDTPSIPNLTNDDWIIFSGAKYQIAAVETFEPNAGWIITTRELVGEQI